MERQMYKTQSCCFQTSHSHWNSWWICVPRYSLKKHVTVSGGVTGRGAHNLYPKSEQSQKMSWPKDSGRGMGHAMKTHKSVPQQPCMSRFSDTLSESWTCSYHLFCLGNSNSQHELETSAQLISPHTVSSTHCAFVLQTAEPNGAPPGSSASLSAMAQLQWFRRSCCAESLTQSMNRFAFATWLVTHEIVISRWSHP